MNIGILGTGVVGQAISAKMDSLGYNVMIGTRDVSKTLAETKPNQYGGPGFSVWYKEHPNIKVGTFAEAADFGEIIFLCLNGAAALDVLKSTGQKKFTGKTVIDITVPLDFSKGMPPGLFYVNDTSLGEEVQKALPDAHIVKTLNMVNCEIMVDPKKAGDDATMFVAGNNSDAKEKVKKILDQ